MIADGGEQLITDTVGLSKKTDFPLVATNDVHYLNQDDARAQQLLICIGEGRTLSSKCGFSEHGSVSAIGRRDVGDIWQGAAGFADKYVKIAEMCELEIPQGDEVTAAADLSDP